MSDLTVTNRDLWTAHLPNPDQAFPVLLRVPMTVLGARNASALSRMVRDAVADIEVARLVLCAQFGTKEEGEPNYTITDPDAFAAGWDALLAESIVLANVRAVHVDDLAPSAIIAPDVLGRLGALLEGV